MAVSAEWAFVIRRQTG